MTTKLFAGAISLGLSALVAFAISARPSPGRVDTQPDATNAKEIATTVIRSTDPDNVRSGRQLAAFGDSCSDSIANCTDPVKHLGTQGDCACFACAYGTSSQRNVCTKNAADKEALFRRAR